MALWAKLAFWRRTLPLQEHLERGRIGEQAAREYLEAKGWKFLIANYAGSRGEIDLIFRDGNCLVFVEVKTRTGEGMTRPGKAVDRDKKQAIARTAREYIRKLDDPRVPYRFDIVEVILENDEVIEIRHIQQSFTTENLWRRKH
jgi:putative endonuclease